MNCPGCGAPLEAHAFDGRTEVDVCPGCHGVWYDLADLAVDVELAEGGRGKRACPRDGETMAVGRTEKGAVEVDRCLTCGGVWLDAGEVQKLRAAMGVDKIVGAKDAPPPLPAAGRSTVKPAPEVPELLKPRRRGKGGAEEAPEPRDSGGQQNPDEWKAPVVTVEGAEFRHFQTSWPKVKFVLGEFPWKVKVGDEAKTRDFVAPPRLVSQELTGSDSTWTLGEYLEPSEVWGGFGLPGEPPARSSTAPAQPNPHEETWRAVRWWGFGALAAAAALFAALATSARNETVFTQEYPYDKAAAAAEPSFVTPEFELKGGPSSVRVDIDANVSNSWGFFRMALINSETDTALHFEREVSYYWGSEDGESWSEGSRSDTVYLSRVPAGRYYLHVDPEGESSFSYRVTVRRDSPRLFHLGVAWALLALPLGWIWARRHVFEVARWAESDHPMSSSSDDEDDD